MEGTFFLFSKFSFLYFFLLLLISDFFSLFYFFISFHYFFLSFFKLILNSKNSKSFEFEIQPQRTILKPNSNSNIRFQKNDKKNKNWIPMYLKVQKCGYVNVWTLKMNMKHKSKSNICKWRCCTSTKIEYVTQSTPNNKTHNNLNCNIQAKFKQLATSWIATSKSSSSSHQVTKHRLCIAI